MRYIGFKNFRRFEELKPLPLAPITIFVGGNNSGKSTVVKGMLSILGFFEDDCLFEHDEGDYGTDEMGIKIRPARVAHNQRFYFNKNYYAHIGTCSRALRCGAKPKEISFIFGTGSFQYEIIVGIDDESEEATSGRIVKIRIMDQWNIEFIIDLVQWSAEIVFHPSDLEKYKRAVDEAKDEPSRSYAERKYEYFKSVKEEIRIPIKHLSEYSRDFRDYGNVVDVLCRVLANTLNPILEQGAGGLLPRNDKEKAVASVDLSEDLRLFLINSPLVSKYGGEPKIMMRSHRMGESIEYIYAHAVTQTVIYSAKDTNDYLVKTVHDFANSRISRSSKGEKRELYQFIIQWMKVFEIGEDYTVRSIGGEAHIVKIKNMKGELVNMADMGMGSIQLMILLFRIGALLSRGRRRTTIILEEPEQNLHPKLQSHLADLLLTISEKFNLRFIVETHSEYLIRKTQVIVGERFNTPELLPYNPFRVFYFPSEGQPYDMEYTPSGKFVQPFGEGFFDEAANLHMTVLKNSRK